MTTLAARRLALWPAFLIVHLWLAAANVVGNEHPLGDVTLVYKFWMQQGFDAHYWVGIDGAWVYPIVAIVPMLLAWAFGPDAYAFTWLALVTVLDAVAFGYLVGWRGSVRNAARRLVVARLPLSPRTHRAGQDRHGHRAPRDHRGAVRWRVGRGRPAPSSPLRPG